MREPILVINAGSSSVKYSVFETAPNRSLRAGPRGQVEGIGTSPRLEVKNASGRRIAAQAVDGDGHVGAIEAIHEWFVAHLGSEAMFAGVGHRVVHGGLAYHAPTLIDDKVAADLAALVPLAPLHQPHNLAAIRAMALTAPKVAQVACFDTAFHCSQSAVAQEFALPVAYQAKGSRRYGFPGLSYEYIVSALPEVAPECMDGKLVVAHLGNGASMCAIHRGRSIATTMGFIAVDGLPMGTRTGSLDPGVLLYLLQHEGMNAQAIERLIYEQSGLLGVSGISSDMRDLLASDAKSAHEAVDLFVYRIGRELGSLAAALGWLDALIFSAGIGEHATEIRARVCRDVRWLGVIHNEEANARNGPRISSDSSRVSVWVIPTDENLMIGRQTRRLLDATRDGLMR